ncbi:uncharacterized protein [Montipora capricornis]|uniref:uncharacterized protein n=1 Tax=Montipora foliosa TaxID=591990 RepID=UPI0035F10886
MGQKHVKVLLILAITLSVFRRVEGALLAASGCYKDKTDDRALPELLYNARTQKDGLNWSDPTESVINKCKERVEEKGYNCFGIQFYGECWSGDENACAPENYKRHGESTNCYCSRNSYKKYDSNSECRVPVGGKLANFVYTIRY